MHGVNTFLMMGRPGSGKRTQANLLAEKIGAKIFSSGDEFRATAASEVYLGKRIKGAMERGELLPHWLASYLYEKTILALEPEDNIVFEGTCRTEPESILFHDISLWLPRLYVAINLEISPEETMTRLLKRQEGRTDDAAGVIQKRLEEYTNKTTPAIKIHWSR